MTAAIFSRVLASLTLLERQAAHRLQKSSSSRRLAMVSSTDIAVLLAVAFWPWMHLLLAMLIFLFVVHGGGRSLGFDAWLRRKVPAKRKANR